MVTDDAWTTICRIIGRPELAQDPRYVNRFERDHRAPEINALLEEWAAGYTNVEVAEILQDSHVPGGAYLDLAEVAASPQYAHREFFREVDHPAVGRAKYPTVPYRLSETPWRVSGAAPQLGADTDGILRERLGATDADLAALRQAGVIS